MQNYSSKFKKGFTLIELLVVVALIGVLATLVLANLNAARQRGRDAQRKSDLRNIQTALRLYYNDYGKYPTSMVGGGNFYGCGTGGVDMCFWGGPFIADGNTYMSILPEDPTHYYKYTQIDADTYTLEACLENKSDEKCETIGEDPANVWCEITFDGCVYRVQQ